MKLPRDGLEDRDGTLWWRNIAFVPSLHGRVAFARETRRLFLSDRFATVAVELPPSLRDATLEGVLELPRISVVSYEDTDGTRCYFPIDPCDSIVEAVRLAVAESCQLEWIDAEVENFERVEVILPDPYSVQVIQLASYYRAVRPALPPTAPGSQDDARERAMADRLFAVSRERPDARVLCVLGLSHLAGVTRRLERLAAEIESGSAVDSSPRDDERRALLEALPPNDVIVRPATAASLVHLLGEIPYLTWLWEKRRGEITLDEFELTDELTQLLLDARDRYHETAEDFERISTMAFEQLLKLIRNLSLLGRRLTPQLYEIVLAAKGIGGGAFALEVVRLARTYPPMTPEPSEDDSASLDRPPADGDEESSDSAPEFGDSEPGSASTFGPFGLDPYAPIDVAENRMQIDDRVVPARKRYIDEQKEWKRIRLPVPPRDEERARWQSAWNPLESCSWEPEDRLIESFAGQVRHRALAESGLAEERLEEFSTSMKDGLHLRETIRNLHLGKIIVREVPTVRGQVGAVVVVYDKPDPKKYPWRLTWFSEQEWESTLSFYATDYRRDIVGPGIGRALYGGQLFLYPPRFIVDVWSDPTFDLARDDAERLVFAALLHSRERFVAYVAPNAPTRRMKTYAEKVGRRLVYLPLSGFSGSTLEKLRRFHVLNGKPVRSYAQKYIR